MPNEPLSESWSQPFQYVLVLALCAGVGISVSNLALGGFWLSAQPAFGSSMAESTELWTGYVIVHSPVLSTRARPNCLVLIF